jgi:hypothetical protein
MRRSAPRLADLGTLTAALTHILRDYGLAGGQATVLDRQPNIYEGTFPTEIVTCRLEDGSERQLLCKYGSNHWDNVYGHKGGGPYEAQVYRQVLQPLRVATPKFYGALADADGDRTFLVFEYLDGGVWVNKTPEPAAMGLAARWIGQFHALGQGCLTGSRSFLRFYDTAYYSGWACRTSLYAGHLHERFPWLAKLCERSEEFAALLLAPSATIIHGEYYPENVLFHDGAIFPVDWESAAIAAGEIDLASLTEGWPIKAVTECTLEYQRARWPEGTPPDFERALAAAQLYLHLRWLGDRPEWTTDRTWRWRFGRLRTIGEQLGMI